MIYFSTQKGANKTESEDAVLVGRDVFAEISMVLPLPETGFICVADGVGGNSGGRIASHFVLNQLSAYTCYDVALYDFVTHINENLLSEARASCGYETMATTLTGIYISPDKWCSCHVGNTRMYVKQGNYLKQLTSDHTTYNWLRSMGRIDEANHCNRSEIVSCLGGGNSGLMKNLHVAPLGNYNTFLLTSDGVHDFVSIDYLEDIISSPLDGLEKCENIIDAAKSAGSEDDMTVVLVSREV